MLNYLFSVSLGILAVENGELHRAKAAFIVLVGILVGWYQRNAFVHTPPVVWVSVFWTMDWILGSILALYLRKWLPRKAFFSIVKWMVYVSALAVAFGLRESQILGGWAISGMIETAILCAEVSSVMRNGARLTNSKILHWFADSLDHKVDELTHEKKPTPATSSP